MNEKSDYYWVIYNDSSFPEDFHARKYYRAGGQVHTTNEIMMARYLHLMRSSLRRKGYIRCKRNRHVPGTNVVEVWKNLPTADI